nr:uncharacterized protein DKFZp434B061 [Oryza sativa Japonica Group]
MSPPPTTRTPSARAGTALPSASTPRSSSFRRRSTSRLCRALPSRRHAPPPRLPPLRPQFLHAQHHAPCPRLLPRPGLRPQLLLPVRRDSGSSGGGGSYSPHSLPGTRVWERGRGTKELEPCRAPSSPAGELEGRRTARRAPWPTGERAGVTPSSPAGAAPVRQPSVCGPCEAPLRACRLPRASFLARRRPPFHCM